MFRGIFGRIRESVGDFVEGVRDRLFGSSSPDVEDSREEESGVDDTPTEETVEEPEIEVEFTPEDNIPPDFGGYYDDDITGDEDTIDDDEERTPPWTQHEEEELPEGEDSDAREDLYIDYEILLKDGRVVTGRIRRYSYSDDEDLIRAMIFSANGDIDSGDVVSLSYDVAIYD